jgi:hypothetical protein
VSQALSRQTEARGGQGTTNVEVLERYNTPPPTGAGQAAYLFARSRIGGRPYYHFALVNTAPIDANSWTYYSSTVAAPDGVFQRDFGLMLNVWRSWSLNQQMLRDRLQDAANKMRQPGGSCARPRVGRARPTIARTMASATTSAASRCSSTARPARAETSIATSPTRS